MENTINIKIETDEALLLKALRNIMDKFATKKDYSVFLHEYRSGDYFHHSLVMDGKIADISFTRQWDFSSIKTNEEMKREARDLMDFIDEINL